MSDIPLSTAAIVMRSGVVSSGQTYEARANWVNSKLITAITAATKRVERDGFITLDISTSIVGARSGQCQALGVSVTSRPLKHMEPSATEEPTWLSALASTSVASSIIVLCWAQPDQFLDTWIGWQ